MAAKVKKRVTLEMVTSYNLDSYKKTWHKIASLPDRFTSFGSWTNLDAEVKDDWNNQLFLISLEKESKEPIGVVRISRGHFDSSCTIDAVALLPEYRHRGIGTIASRLALRHCFEILGAHKVESSAFSSNPVSVQMQKGGMRKEGVIRDAAKLGGQFYDKILFGILRSEWDAQVSRHAKS